MENLWVRGDCGANSHKQALVAHKNPLQQDKSQNRVLNSRWNKVKTLKMTICFFLFGP